MFKTFAVIHMINDRTHTTKISNGDSWAAKYQLWSWIISEEKNLDSCYANFSCKYMFRVIVTLVSLQLMLYFT